MRFVFRCLLLFCLYSLPVMAEGPASTPAPETKTEVLPAKELSEEEARAAKEKEKQQIALESLDNTLQALKEKEKELVQLQRTLKRADETEKKEILAALDALSADIKNLRSSFEQVAIGGISLETFEQTEQEFDWKEELVLITQPVLESLKDLTEKPRKTERLRSIINDRTAQAKEIERAIESINSRLASQPSKAIFPILQRTLEVWEGKQKDNLREIELAEFQLESLLGNNKPWYVSVSHALKSFFGGRGTTILIAITASAAVWFFMKLLLWLLLVRNRRSNDSRKQTRYRLAYYLYRILTSLMVGITIMVVLYVRGDLLLLAIMIIVFMGLILALRELLPRYVNEARTLLNLGTIREGERVLYRGIPWQVTHINVHTIFRNPELQGVLRVPLSEVVELNSRPVIRDEEWFPCHKSDLLLMPDGLVAEVLIQTPETIELKSRGGMRLSYATDTLYGMAFHNLTRGGSYGVASTFGIDYSHAAISLTTVPEAFKVSVEEGLRSAGLSEHVLDVLVDFSQANSSSLDYLIYVTMHSRAASSYFKVSRVIQQSCLKTCNEENWGIPYPQMTIHRAD